MNFLNILNEIEKVDADVIDRLNPRRAAMKEFFNVGKKVAIASVPLAIGSMFKKAYGQSVSPAVINALNYALAIEHFSAEFYTRGFNEVNFSQGSFAAADKAAIGIIRDHELGHVEFLKGAISSAGGTPVAKGTYNFSPTTQFRNVFTNYEMFLTVAQGLEDTGLRASKGAAADLASQSAILTAALNIHSVEARHSAKIRLMRIMSRYSTTLQPWISLADETETDVRLGAENYAGEENTRQAGFEITGINGNTSIDAARASEAFDEPLSKEKVSGLLSQFGVVV